MAEPEDVRMDAAIPNQQPVCRLTAIAGTGGFKVVRDGCFLNLGFLSDPHPGMLAFVESTSQVPAVLRLAGQIACILTTAALARQMAEIEGLAVVADPKRAFFAIHNHLALETEFYGPRRPSRVDGSAIVHPTAYVDPENVFIEPGAVVGPNATLLEGTILGQGVRVEASTTIGGRGFQSARSGAITDMLPAGSVNIESGAVVLSNSVIARGMFRQSTTIEAEAHVGNLVFISHNVHLGRRSFVGHGASVAGNVRIGSDVWIGPNATIVNNVRIGDGANISLGAVVIGDVTAGEHVSGNFSIEHRRFLRHIAGMR